MNFYRCQLGYPSNVKEKIVLVIAFVLAIATLAFSLCSCKSTATSRAMEEQETRFTSEESVFVNTITDTETGVQYLFAYDGYKGGLCPLLNTDGTPYTVDADDE